MKTFDCNMTFDIPPMEIDAADEGTAKRLYAEAVKRLLDDDAAVCVLEVEIVD